MKKLLCLALASVLALSLFACGNEEAPSEEAKPSEEVSEEASNEEKPAMGGTQIANPFYTFETMEEAEEVIDFTITLPEVPEWANEVLYRPTTDGTMFEVIYSDGEDEIRMRKSTRMDDISGIYDEFEIAEDVDVDGKMVTVKGDGEKMSLAMWKTEDFSYFVRVSAGASLEEMTELVKAIA